MTKTIVNTEPGCILNVEGPFFRHDGTAFYEDKETREIRTGWYHCGCCGQDGLGSMQNSTCTECCNKLIHGSGGSPKPLDEIIDYCRKYPISVNGTLYIYYASSNLCKAL